MDTKIQLMSPLLLELIMEVFFNGVFKCQIGEVFFMITLDADPLKCIILHWQMIFYCFIKTRDNKCSAYCLLLGALSRLQICRLTWRSKLWSLQALILQYNRGCLS